MTQNNRGVVLRELASLSEQDHNACLLAALDAYDQALRFRTPVAAPLDYAMTQNNRGTVLQDLAGLPEQDRKARLLAALNAYDQALRFYTPASVSLDYAMTQGNLLNLYQEMADLPGADRQQYSRAALQAGWSAYTLFSSIEHAPYQQRAMWQLRRLRTTYGADFAVLWAELGVGEPPEWLGGAD